MKENNKVSSIVEIPTDWGGSTDSMEVRLEGNELKLLTV